MTTKKIPFNYDINRMLAVDLIAIIHIDDYDTRFLELTLFDDGTPFSVDGCTVTSRFVTISGNYLLSDNVPCEATGNTITIPIDAAAVQMMACDIKIEVNIVDGEKILTLPFPLWVRVRGSILEAAHVTPESQGTIPELLKEAAEELARVKDFVTAENVFEILDGTLQGNPNTAPTLLIDNTIDQQFNPDGHWIMFYIDSEDVRHNLFDFANLSSGTSDYQELENKPQINSHTLSGNKSSDDLGLQKKLTAGQNITIGNDGTISASGGVTSYNDLNNKPQIGFTGRRVTLENILNFHFGDFNGEVLPNGVDIGLRENVFKSSLSPANDILYNFNQIKSNLLYTGVFKIRKVDVTNLPQEFTDAGSTIYVYHYVSTKTYSDLIRMVTYETADGVKMWSQLATLGGMDASDNVQVTAQTDWVELTGGGSQIVSGVVNANGTITFTDSDGNTFTTTGSSVIGADGFSPVATVTQTASGATVSITDSTGTTTANISNGQDGNDYVLTAQDKDDIADIVLAEFTGSIVNGELNTR